ncbi:MAG: hypothetical protein M1822_005878 [Bathelium mastoideum]|nr:MAG: hypothetical protein M1822_005878 [Bathelium mastoideum]
MAWPTRGERFDIELGSEHAASNPVHASSLAFISDIKERSPSVPHAPSAPAVKNQTTGFPAHKKRSSKFASRGQTNKASESVLSSEYGHGPSSEPTNVKAQQTQADSLGFEEREGQTIEAENQQKLSQMSDAEIEEARAEVLASLNPALVQKLLRRANIDDGRHDGDFPSLTPDSADGPRQESSKPPKKVSFQDDAPSKVLGPSNTSPPQPVAKDLKSDHAVFKSAESPFPSEPPLSNTHDQIQDVYEPSSIHFPNAPRPPDLDPTSESFLSDLHSKYFPDLSHDPSKLDWMKESSDTLDSHSAANNYLPDAPSYAPSEIRFSFTGALLAPRTAHSIPVTEGLHHHGQAPDAAGYTIGELAILARSSYPSQRCIAYSVLGKLLFRLGKGQFGDTMAEDVLQEDENGEFVDDARDREERIAREKGELARGLWQIIHNEHIIDILTAAASDEGEKRHLSAKAYAQEAVWLWRRGGGRRWKAE